MIGATTFVAVAAQVSMALLLLAVLIAVVRLCRGPSLGDRILALDLITVLAVGLVAVFAVLTGITFYLDVAIAVALLGFLSTVALARYLSSRIAVAKGPAGKDIVG